MFVKICGIQTTEMVQVAIESGADFIGLVFAESKRQVTIDQAKNILTNLSDTEIKVVGVFRNQSIEEVNQVSRELGLDYVQLHGDESVEACKEIDSPLIKALSFKEISQAKQYLEIADYVLIDHPKPGSGETFDWTKVTGENIPFFLAGGLSSDNVREAIQQVNPIGVDVSSGVETNGRKDDEKIRQFIHQAKQTDKR